MKSKICGIYKITSPSGRVYVGQSRDMKRRWGEYNNFKKLKQQIKIYRSFVKYGKDTHVFEVIEECSIEHLNEREIYWGLYFNVLDKKKGLNNALGGQTTLYSDEYIEKRREMSKGSKNPFYGKKHTEEQKKRLSDIRKNRKLTEEHKEALHSSRRGKAAWNSGKKYTAEEKEKCMPKIPAFLGKKHTDETKKLMSDAQKGKPSKLKGVKRLKGIVDKCAKAHWIPVNQYDLDGNFIREWNSLKEATLSLRGITNSTHISTVCKGKRKTAYGFKWKYKSEINNEEHNNFNGNI